MSLLKSTALVTALAAAVAAGAQESKRVVLKDRNGTIVGPVIDSEPGSNQTAFVSLATPFGPTLVKFDRNAPAVSTFTKLYTSTDCSGTPWIVPNPGLWVESFVDDNVGRTLLALDPSAPFPIQVVRKIDVPGPPVCTSFVSVEEAAMLVPVMNLNSVHPGGYTLENVQENTFLSR